MESIQRWTTKHIFTLYNFLYEEWLKQLDMFPLHKQRIRRDMIEVYKFLNNFNRINPIILFEMNNATVTRGNGILKVLRWYNTAGRNCYFSGRVVDHWNRFTASVVTSKTIVNYKFWLDVCFRKTGFYYLINWLLGMSFYEIFMYLILFD